MDDIAALEKLWLEAHGQQTISGTPAQQQVYSGPSEHCLTCAKPLVHTVLVL